MAGSEGNERCREGPVVVKPLGLWYFRAGIQEGASGQIRTTHGQGFHQKQSPLLAQHSKQEQVFSTQASRKKIAV